MHTSCSPVERGLVLFAKEREILCSSAPSTLQQRAIVTTYLRVVARGGLIRCRWMRERTVVSFWEPVFVLSLDQAVMFLTQDPRSADFSHLPPKALRWNHDTIQQNLGISKDFDSEPFVCTVWLSVQGSGRVGSARGWIIGATAL